MVKILFLSLLTVQLWATHSFAQDPCRVVLVPGAFGSSKSSFFLSESDYFSEYKAYYETKGCVVRKINFPADSTIELRARILRDQIQHLENQVASRYKVLIVAHSQGALDSRFALKTLGLQGVGALVSIGAPEHGTKLADWVAHHRDSGSFLYLFLKWIGRYDLKALSFLSEMQGNFIESHQNYFSEVSGVKYLYARGICKTHCHFAFKFLDWMSGEGGIGSPLGGDGIIGAQEQVFGESLGDFDLDHISEVSTESESRPERLKILNKTDSYVFLE